MIYKTDKVKIKKIQVDNGVAEFGFYEIDKSKYIEKEVGELPKGAKFVYGRKEWIKLDDRGCDSFVAQADVQEGAFCGEYEKVTYEWERSKLRDYINDWKMNETFFEIYMKDLKHFPRKLVTGCYSDGIADDVVSILTLSEYDEYKPLLPPAIKVESEMGEEKEVPAEEFVLTASDDMNGLTVVNPDGTINDEVLWCESLFYRRAMMMRGKTKVFIEKGEKR